MYAASAAKYVGSPSGADEHAILVVAVRARARPERAVLLERVEQRDRLRDLGLDVALPLPRVEVDAEALERRLDPLEHRRHRIAGKRRELRDVLAVVAVLGRLLAAPHRLDRRVEALHLRAGVVVVVLALDVVTGERQKPRDRSRRTRRSSPCATVTGPVGFADTISTWMRCRLRQPRRTRTLSPASTICRTPSASQASGSQRFTNPGPAASARSASPLGDRRAPRSPRRSRAVVASAARRASARRSSRSRRARRRRAARA